MSRVVIRGSVVCASAGSPPPPSEENGEAMEQRCYAKTCPPHEYWRTLRHSYLCIRINIPANAGGRLMIVILTLNLLSMNAAGR